jgi:hypothetical protein
MTLDPAGDEEVLKALPDEILAQMSEDQRAVLVRVFARLEAAEKVCMMVRTSLSPKLRQASPTKLNWWDIGIAVKEWETLANP